MSVDFKALHIRSLLISAFLTCGPEEEKAVSEKIRGYMKGWPRSTFSRFGLHVNDGFARHADLSVRRRPWPSRLIHVSLDVHRVPNDKMPRAARLKREIAVFDEISDVLSHIETLDVGTRCHGHVTWEFDPGTHESIIKLPMLSTTGGRLPFDSISGVRFTKQSEDGDISIIVDRYPSGAMGVVAQMPLRDRVSLRLVDEVALGSSKMIEEFILPVPTEPQ